MSDIKKLDQDNYVTVQEQYAVINEGTGYAIINIETKQIIARNISSFLDCVKTLEYMVGKGESLNPMPSQNQPKHQIPNFNVREDVQQLIEIYAPTTVKVEKKTNVEGSRYKCYDSSGNCLGRVKGKLGSRYWQDTAGNTYYLNE
ncbi:hypothetical protein [Floridanema aerugineum]|uniref:Uncharacterized protein n=1 Tax=Floridaenema aerugineum BLCC-F46 TaxID=3153654 RepID=A0ABV4XC55_9CYAN